MRHWLIVTVLTLLASGPIVHVQAPATPPADQYRAIAGTALGPVFA